MGGVCPETRVTPVGVWFPLVFHTCLKLGGGAHMAAAMYADSLSRARMILCLFSQAQ